MCIRDRAVADGLGRQAACGGDSEVVQHTENGTVRAGGGVRPGQCGFDAVHPRDGDRGAEGTVGDVVSGDALGVRSPAGTTHIPGGRSLLTLGEGVVRPAGQLVRRGDAPGVHAGLPAEEVVAVGEGVADGVSGVVDLRIGVVIRPGHTRVRVGRGHLAAAKVVLVGPVVTAAVGPPRGQAAGREAERGDVRVGGVARCGRRAVLPGGDRPPAGIGHDRGGGGPGRRRDVGAVGPGVRRGAGPLGVGVGAELRADDPAVAVVGVPGRTRHLAVLDQENRALREVVRFVVGGGRLDRPAVRVIHGVRDQTSDRRSDAGALGLPRPAQTVEDLDAERARGLVLVEGFGHDPRRTVRAVHGIGERPVRELIGRPARSPNPSDAAQGVVPGGGDAPVDVLTGQR